MENAKNRYIIYQVGAGIGTMSALVGFRSRVQARVSPQVGTDVCLEVAARVAATVRLGLLGCVYGILVPHPVPGINTISLNWNNTDDNR